MSSARVPHEAEPVEALITAWPVHRDWLEHREQAGAEVARLLIEAERRKLAARLVVADAAAETQAIEALQRAGRGDEALCGSALRLRYGDIWLRDIGPVFMLGAEGLEAAVFRFNGWGEKYRYAGDDDFAERLANAFDARVRRSDLVCEGGALEFDGEGTVLTTRQCLLNKNRNPSLSESDVETELKRALNVERVLWVDEGLIGDHTDGHIDNLARFVAPGVVVCQAPSSPDDPNRAVYDAVARALDGAEDAAGRRIEVDRIPAPRPILDDAGGPLAASHMNFVHMNGVVVMPAFDLDEEPGDFTRRASDEAADALQRVFDGAAVAPLSARAIVTGGGSFHCCTNAIPKRGRGA